MKKNTYKLDIIFEDNYLVAINKPAGLLTIPDRYDKSLPSVVTLLKENYENIFIIHRLDFGTSGVLLFAKTPEAHVFLSKQFANHTIRKIYNAIVTGVIHDEEVEIDIPLIQNLGRKGGVVPSARGKNSLTIVKVLDRFRNATFIEAQLKTGRQHQLRAHVAAIGYPLLVDELYGSTTEFYLSSIKKKFNLKKHTTEKPIITRPTLHSREISFVHPKASSDTELTTITADFPKDFSAILQILKKYSSNL